MTALVRTADKKDRRRQRNDRATASPICIPRPADAPTVEAPSNAPGPAAMSAAPQVDAAALERMQPYVGNTVGGISTVTGSHLQ